MSSQIDSANLQLLEEMYAHYLENPGSVDASWIPLFQNLEKEAGFEAFNFPSPLGGELRVLDLIDAYRSYGHLYSKTNPILIQELVEPQELDIKRYGFRPEDLHSTFPTYGLLEKEEALLSEIIDRLRKIYCGSVGIEYMGLNRQDIERFIQERIEPNGFKVKMPIEQKKMILQHLNKSELLEVFLHTKYVGQKRFSLEGAETLIPILEALIENGVKEGIEDFILGMAHRGRLNVLTNILNKSYMNIFSEFEDSHIPESFEGSGDVKYHKGFFSEDKVVDGHKIRITLTPNPSHLEGVDPVVEGQALGTQILLGDEKKEKVLPVLIHGDAAISGQGVVYETLQFSRLEGYSTGGTVHIVINNQIGFTTLPSDGRSTLYCTDIAKAFQAPVFHLNAEDPEACVNAMRLAFALRQKFHIEVFLDLVCWRKYGHNETDEPAYTQPLEYQVISRKKTIREIYRDDLIAQGVLERQMAESLEVEFKESLQKALTEIKTPRKAKLKDEAKAIADYSFEPFLTGVPKNILVEATKRFSAIPEGFTLHPKLAQLVKARASMVQEGESAKPIDWGMGETLAYASLLWNGISIRLAGQDSCRGTFSHRHGMWMDQVKEQAYFPLKHLKEGQGRFDLINSPLSEYAALGFEYGYSIAEPDTLVIWEAQFGDFCNGAQVVIDQFITTGEQKWSQKSGLTLLLPHGYEGQGPEHSSARIERFLTLCGNNNIQVVYPTTPAQLFHLLRRQAMSPIHKPLVVFTPKGLLRHPACVSKLADLTKGSFVTIIDDPQPPKKTGKLVFCSGRIYYDLVAAREKFQVEDMALIRVEQLYPLDIELLGQMIQRHIEFENCYWVQEEPSNMGAWGFISPILSRLLPIGKSLQYIGRERSASPAVGSHALHQVEHEAIVNELFGRQRPSIFEIASESKGKS